jgi:segregation and condensation protein B
MTEPSTPETEPALPQVAPEDRPAAIGALLFVAGGAVALDVTAWHLGCRPAEVSAALTVLADQLAAFGLALQRSDQDNVELVTELRFAALIQRFLGLERTVRLSQAALETLAIVAYRQPVTRADLDSIRGVDSSGVLETLFARGLVEPVGRLATVGSPIQYGTTPAFLRFFGLMSLDELSSLNEDSSSSDESGRP